MPVERPHPAELALPEKPLLSREGRIKLLVAVCAIVAWFSIKPALERWLDAQTEAVQTSALGRCRPPAEFEQLHVVVLNRGGRLVLGDCMFVGARGAYAK